MAPEPLAVLLHGHRIGDLDLASGKMQFAYTDPTNGRRLSLSMPPQVARVWKPKVAVPWFSALLPDNADVRIRWGRLADVNPRNPHALLGHYGADLAGAVQVCPPDRIAEVTSRPASWEPVDDRRIGALLRAENADDASWPAERWSLAGMQAKIAVARTPDGWMSPSGAAASTHIIKPGIPTLPHQALGEHLALVAAGKLGHQVAATQYREFDGVPAIVIERYDRFTGPGGAVGRLHQEDMCQALGVRPESKYQADGGPTGVAITRLLAAQAGSDDARRFARGLIFNFVAGAPDAHAKNYSVVLGDRRQTAALAPLYDVASAYPYLEEGSRRFRTVAMPIGGAKEFGTLAPRHLERFAAATGLDGEELVADAREQAQRLPDALADAAASTGGVFARAMAGQIAAGVEKYAFAGLELRSPRSAADVVAPMAPEGASGAAGDDGGGQIWVGPYFRGGKPVEGYWRSRPQS